MNVAALRQMVRVLESIPPQDFDLSYWRADGLQPPKWQFWKHSCPAVACAVGWAAADPWFVATGLKLVNNQPVYQDFRSWDAVESLFDIDIHLACYLFSADEYRSGAETTPDQVIYRLQQVIECQEIHWWTRRRVSRRRPKRRKAPD